MSDFVPDFELEEASNTEIKHPVSYYYQIAYSDSQAHIIFTLSKEFGITAIEDPHLVIPRLIQYCIAMSFYKDFDYEPAGFKLVLRPEYAKLMQANGFFRTQFLADAAEAVRYALNRDVYFAPLAPEGLWPDIF
jgi:hypothetical protein